MAKKDTVWFTPDKVLSYNAMLNFVVGQRSCGKTYGTKKWAIKHFLKTGKHFIYLRRTKQELKDLDKFFDTLRLDKELAHLELTVKGRRFYCNGVEMGKADVLSMAQSKKGVEEPLVDTIIFDEFIVEKGYMRYLPDEVNTLLSYMLTIFRNREQCRCICLANSISWNNPYFVFYKFLPMDKGFQIRQDGEVVLNVYDSSEFKKAQSETKFAKLIKDTAYSEMAMDNKFEDVNENFIKKKTADAHLLYNIQWKDKVYGLWLSNNEQCYIVSYRYNPDAQTLCYSTKDYKPNMMLLTERNNSINRTLKNAFTYGFIYFEDIYIRNDMYDIFALMGIR